MTWSIVARDARSGGIGVAVATCAFAVGARVPFAATGVGVIATQSHVNPFYGPRGLELLRQGATPGEVVRILTEADRNRAVRQLQVLDAGGRSAAFTGDACVGWCGQRAGEGYSLAGNMLAGPDVLEATERAFRASEGEPLARRFLAALAAGQAAGGDRRGRQSAAMLIHDMEEYPLVDIRVDDAADPLAELARLLGLHERVFLPYRSLMPNRLDPHGLVTAEMLATEAGNAAPKRRRSRKGVAHVSGGGGKGRA